MAGETVTVRMSRSDTQTPWGFRLEGGVDYQRPIIIAGNAITASGNNVDMVLNRWTVRYRVSPACLYSLIVIVRTSSPGVQKALNSPAGAMGVNPATLAAVKAEDEARTRGRSRSPGYQPSPQQQQMAHRTAPHQQINQQEYGEDDYLKTKDPLLRKMQRKNDGAMIAKTIHNLELMQKAGKTFHGDCFKCCTCGSSLKNVGFSNIAGKLYCDIHAAQRQQNQFTSRPPQDPSIFVYV
ncbi:unnamed protein product [Sphagnum balticum]